MNWLGERGWKERVTINEVADFLKEKLVLFVEESK